MTEAIIFLEDKQSILFDLESIECTREFFVIKGPKVYSTELCNKLKIELGKSNNDFNISIPFSQIKFIATKI